jgi:NAD(P)-dependent dehydrogenase (short-subunit alcohol dehydrogenase family)
MPFGHESTTEKVLDGIDLSGIVAVVTGATGGIGLETARAFTCHGAHVVLAGRDAEKGRVALDRIAAAAGDPSIEFAQVDLADLASVRAFADGMLRRHPAIGLLVNNAGVMATPFARTADGFELQLATNYLGHFVLTARLTPALVAGGPARVVNVTSSGPALTRFRWDDPNFLSSEYDKFDAYGQSKSAAILHAVELDRRLGSRGVRAFAASPGLTTTDLGRHLTRDDLKILLRRLSVQDRRTGAWPRTVEQGAATVVWAATSPALASLGGLLCEDCSVTTVPPHVGGAGDAQRLWRLSAQLTGETIAL